MKTKKTRGGTRKNAGAKPKYNELTKTIAFRVPISKIDEIKKIVKIKLIDYVEMAKIKNVSAKNETQT